MNSKVDKVYNALKNGEELTARQIATRFGLANPRHAVYTLRREGFSVSLVRRKNNAGVKTRKYVLPLVEKNLLRHRIGV